MQVGVSACETHFDAVAAAEEAFGVEGLVDVADEVDDELGVLVGWFRLKGERGADLGGYCALVGIEVRVHEAGCLRVVSC